MEAKDKAIDLISVIVPVYNGITLLPRCIESIINQTYSTFEIVIIDDGSTDGTDVLCDNYACLDTRIKVVHKKQGGVADARNIGLESCAGDYITFVDSDDVICSTYLETLLLGIKSNSVDISLCKHWDFSEDSNLSKMSAVSPSNTSWHIETGRDICLHIYDYKEAPQYVAPWAKLYKRSCFNTIRFPKGRMNEDQFTTYKVLYGKTIAYTEEKLYFYYANPSSVSNSGFSLKRYDNLYALEEAEQFYKEAGDEELVISSNRLKLLIASMFVFCAKEQGIYNQVPTQFRVDERTAAHVIYESLGNNDYEWFVSKTHPLFIQIRAIIRKVLGKLT